MQSKKSCKLIKAIPLMCVLFSLISSTAFGNHQQAKPAEVKPSIPSYHKVNKITPGGEGGWDYLTVDSNARRLYVSHATKVVVIDIDKNSLVGEIPNTNGVHGIAIASDLGRGFTSNGRDSNVTIFDLQTLKILGQVKTGNNPDAILYDPFSKRVFSFNGASADATAIDAKTGMVVGTIALGGKPEFATSLENGKIFVNIEDKSEVVVLDSQKLNILAHWPLAPGEEPTGMALDEKNKRLFIGCSNKLMVVLDAENGHLVASLPIGAGVDATAFDPETNLAFSSNGEGTLTVIHEDSPSKFSVLENVATQRGARTCALDVKTHNLYLATAEFGPPPTPTKEQPRPRPTILPGSFTVLVYGK